MGMGMGWSGGESCQEKRRDADDSVNSTERPF